MADKVGYIFEGPGVVYFATPIAAVGGAEPTGHSWGSDVGAIVGGVEYKTSRKYHDVTTDHSIGHYDKYKIDEEVTFTFTLQELQAKNVAYAMDQPQSNVSGTAPAWTLARNLTNRQTLAMKITSSNQGFAATGDIASITITSWRCVVIDCAPVSFKKDGEALLKVTVQAFIDPGVTNAGAAQDTKLVWV